MSLQDFASTAVVKTLAAGYPGTGKTGSLAALANSGRYNLRVLALDGNTTTTVLLRYVKPEFHSRVEVYVPPRDNVRIGAERAETVGIPRRFTTTLNMLDRWKYKKLDGTEVDFGAVKEWGPKDVLVVDNLTEVSTDAFRHVLMGAGRVQKGPRQRDWGTAQDLIRAMVELLASDLVPCNVMVLAHLKMIGPPRPDENDTEEEKVHKSALQEIIPYRLCPLVLGQQLAGEIARYFPFSLLYERQVMGSQVKRVIVTRPREAADAKMPLDLPTELPIDTGLLTIFDTVHGVAKAPEPKPSPVVATSGGRGEGTVPGPGVSALKQEDKPT